MFPRIYRQAAFQTLATTNPEAFGVPGYVTSLSPTNVPCGFEVAITGSSIASAVLVRLVLAARVTASNDIVGFMNQKVIQAVDN